MAKNVTQTPTRNSQYNVFKVNVNIRQQKV